MSTTQSTGRPAVFVAQLHRAAAQRGKLDPVYQDLSDHWTGILQRLYPVWALIGPGLSDPGHIEIHSRTIYLDADTLLGTRQEIIAGRLERQAVLRCFGVALHETFHAKHTKRWATERDIALSESADPAERQLAVDRRLVEEPRMEAHGVREHPAGTLPGRFIRHALQVAVTDVILPAFAEQLIAEAIAGRPLTRDTAGRATVYLQARTHYGIVNPTVLDGLRNVWRQVLGDRDLDRLDELFARLVWIPDGELEALDRAAREYRAIIGPADPPPSEGPGQPADGDAGSGRRGEKPSPASLGDALERALEQAREGQLEQLDADLDLATGSRGRGSRRPPNPVGSPRTRDRDADRPDARPWRRPTSRARRGPARPPLRDQAAPGAHPRNPADRQAHPRRAIRRPRLRPRQSATSDRTARQHPPVADHPAGHRADP